MHQLLGWFANASRTFENSLGPMNELESSSSGCFYGHAVNGRWWNLMILIYILMRMHGSSNIKIYIYIYIKIYPMKIYQNPIDFWNASSALSHGLLGLGGGESRSVSSSRRSHRSVRRVRVVRPRPKARWNEFLDSLFTLNYIMLVSILYGCLLGNIWTPITNSLLVWCHFFALRNSVQVNICRRISGMALELSCLDDDAWCGAQLQWLTLSKHTLTLLINHYYHMIHMIIYCTTVIYWNIL